MMGLLGQHAACRFDFRRRDAEAPKKLSQSGKTLPFREKDRPHPVLAAAEADTVLGSRWIGPITISRYMKRNQRFGGLAHDAPVNA
jgi:hypothetical protein